MSGVGRTLSEAQCRAQRDPQDRQHEAHVDGDRYAVTTRGIYSV